MKITLAILGYIVGVFLGIAILAVTNSDTSNSFIVGNIGGIILAIIGYNYPKKSDSNK